MKHASTIAGVLVGLPFIAFGLMFLFHVMPAPPEGSRQALFMGALFPRSSTTRRRRRSGNMGKRNGALQAASGALSDTSGAGANAGYAGRHPSLALESYFCTPQGRNKPREFFFGKPNDDLKPDNGFKGAVANVKLHNRALTPEEISAEVKSPSGWK